MSTQVTYKGNTIANFANDTKTLKTSGKYMEDDVAITESISLQSKTVTPTETATNVTPDSSYEGLSKVTVNAISSTYVGTGIARKSSTDLTASGSTVTVPVGYYSAQATKNVAAGTAKTPAVTITKNPTVTISSTTGIVTATYTGSSSITPTVTAGYIAAGTAGTVSTTGTSTLTLSTQSAKTVESVGVSKVAVSSGTYLTGDISVNAIGEHTASLMSNGTGDYYQGLTIVKNGIVTIQGTDKKFTFDTGDTFTVTAVAPVADAEVVINYGNEEISSGIGSASATIEVGDCGLEIGAVYFPPMYDDEVGSYFINFYVSNNIKFLIHYDDFGTPSVTCNYTYSELEDMIYNTGIVYADMYYEDSYTVEPMYFGKTSFITFWITNSKGYIKFAQYQSIGNFVHEIIVCDDGTIEYTDWGSSIVQTLPTITENGTYSVDPGYVFFKSPVVVNIPVNTFTATISGSGNSSYAYVQVNGTGTKYYSNGSFQFNSGDTLKIYSRAALTTGNDYGIFINGEKITNVSSYTYTYTLPDGDITIDLQYSSANVNYVKICAPIIPTETLSVTSNGTYNAYSARTVTVNVSSSGKACQISNTVGRATSSTYTAVGPSITVTKTGTYHVYWSGYRSSTSGTNGSQLYINDTAYGSANTTFNTGTGLTNLQSVHLTNVSLSANDVLTIKARSRGNSYYMYIQDLIIIEA